MESVIIEMESKLRSYEGLDSEFSKLREDCMRYKSVSESFEKNITTMMVERNEFLHEIERLKSHL